MSFTEEETGRLLREQMKWGEVMKIDPHPSAFHITGRSDLLVKISPLNSTEPVISFEEDKKILWSAPLTEELMLALDFTKIQILLQLGDRERKIRSVIGYFEKLIAEVNQ